MTSHDTQQPNTTLSSFKMISATIMNDAASKYWSLCFINAVSNASNKKINTLHFVGLLIKILFIFTLLPMALVNPHNILFPLALLILGSASLIIEKKERQKIAAATISELKKYYNNDDLKKLTFYHLSEKISKQLSISSLVDIIAQVNLKTKIIFSLSLFIIIYSPLLQFIALMATIILSAKTLLLEILFAKQLMLNYKNNYKNK